MNRNNNLAFSVLELIVTLFIMSIVSATVLRLLSNTSRQTVLSNNKMQSRHDIEYSLDILIEDLVSASYAKAGVEVENGKDNGCTTSNLMIIRNNTTNRYSSSSIIQWIAADSKLEDSKGIVLYRRDDSQIFDPSNDSQEPQTGMYIPMCDNIQSFEVELLNHQGIDDPNYAPAIVNINARIYSDTDSERDGTIEAFRTFCLRRPYAQKPEPQKSTKTKSDDDSDSDNKDNTNSNNSKVNETNKANGNTVRSGKLDQLNIPPEMQNK